MVQPTLFTSTSTPPNRAAAASAIALTEAGSVTSVSTTQTCPPPFNASASAATRRPWAGSISAMTRWLPSAAKAWTIARPMLEPPPVTITVLPRNPSSI